MKFGEPIKRFGEVLGVFFLANLPNYILGMILGYLAFLIIAFIGVKYLFSGAKSGRNILFWIGVLSVVIGLYTAVKVTLMQANQ